MSSSFWTFPFAALVMMGIASGLIVPNDYYSYPGNMHELELVIEDSGVDGINSSIRCVLDRLHYRLDGNFKVEVDSNIIRLSVPRTIERAELEYLLLARGKLEIWETVSSEKAIPWLLEAEQVYKESMGIVSDSLPFSSLLDYNLMMESGQTYLLKDAVFATLKNPEDIVEVIALLRSPNFKSVLPRSVAPRYQVTSDTYYSQIQLMLVDTLRGEAQISGDMIKQASHEIDEYGQRMVNVELKEVYHDHWSKLTADNIGEQLAICMDDMVLSAPFVHETIAGGRFQISEGTGPCSSQTLVALMNSGLLNDYVRLSANR